MSALFALLYFAWTLRATFAMDQRQCVGRPSNDDDDGHAHAGSSGGGGVCFGYPAGRCRRAAGADLMPAHPAGRPTDVACRAGAAAAGDRDSICAGDTHRPSVRRSYLSLVGSDIDPGP